MKTDGACRDCAFWRDLHDNWAGKGQCRRYPPVTTRTDRQGDHSWPETTGDKWCGEFKTKHPLHTPMMENR